MRDIREIYEIYEIAVAISSILTQRGSGQFTVSGSIVSYFLHDNHERDDQHTNTHLSRLWTYISLTSVSLHVLFVCTLVVVLLAAEASGRPLTALCTNEMQFFLQRLTCWMGRNESIIWSMRPALLVSSQEVRTNVLRMYCECVAVSMTTDHHRADQ